ncbi:MAG: hypothetical protein KC978_22200, partial [Candidatus Omnitrophica bacterium]|nr:hypothetical protein [Candidatus Omnitrophota bacterium]
MNKLLVVILTLAIAAPASFCASEFKTGAASRVVTPEELLPLSGGTGKPLPSTERKGDLFARALVLEQGGTRVALVSLDFIGFPTPLCERIRDRIKNVPREGVLIGSTHTHSAPDIYAFPDEEGNIHADLDYIDWVCTQAAEAVDEAVKNLQRANLKIAHDRIADRIAWNAYAPALFDPRCGVLQAIGEDGDPICTLVNYAIHPEVLGPRRGILSPDICGPFYDRIESQGGGMALFMNGAQGGMVTADNRDPDSDGEIYTWEECIRIGELLANEALRIITDARVEENPNLQIFSREVAFPVESDLLWALGTGSPIMNFGADRTVSIKVNLVNVGSAQMLTIPGEALPNIGCYLKRKMPTEHPFLLGLTNDALGYILTKEDFGAFDRYNYISRTSLGQMTGEIFTEAALEMIDT